MIAAWFLAPLALYLRTMCGAFLPDDSPETIAAMASLEHQHPPGYPLLTLAGRLVLLLPVGGAAFRVTLFAAALAALTCALAGWLAARIADRAGMSGRASRIAGSVACALCATGYIGWSQALSAKGSVYALNAALLVAGLHLGWGALTGERTRTAAVAGLLAGLGLANHWMTVLPAACGMAVALAAAGRLRRLDVRAGAMGAGLMCLGMSTYLLLPVRAVTPERLNWGRPESAAKFLEVVSRGHYRSVELGERPDGYWPARLGHLGRIAMREWTPWLCWAPLAGAAVLLAGVPPGLAMLALPRVAGLTMLAASAGAVLAGALLVANPPVERLAITEPYLVPVSLAASILGGIAAGRAAGAAGAWGWALPVAVAAWGAAAAPRLDASRSYLAYDYGWNLLQGVQPRSVVFCEGDYDLFSLLYHHEAERRRTDVDVLAAVFLDYDWYRETAHRLIPDVIPRAVTLREYTVRPVRPLVYTAQHPGGDGVLRPVGLTLRPPLGTGWSSEVSARVWRSLRYRGIWEGYARGPGSARDVAGSYALQMARFGQSLRTEDPGLAGAALLRAVRLPSDMPGRVLTRYNFAQLILQMVPDHAAGRERALALAESQLNRIIAEAPGFPRAYLLLGNLRFLRGDRAGARAALEQALLALPVAGAEGESAHVRALLQSLR